MINPVGRARFAPLIENLSVIRAQSKSTGTPFLQINHILEILRLNGLDALRAEAIFAIAETLPAHAKSYLQTQGVEFKERELVPVETQETLRDLQSKMERVDLVERNLLTMQGDDLLREVLKLYEADKTTPYAESVIREALKKLTKAGQKYIFGEKITDSTDVLDKEVELCIRRRVEGVSRQKTAVNVVIALIICVLFIQIFKE